MKQNCPLCSGILAPGAPEQEGKMSSYWCYKCDVRFVLPTERFDVLGIIICEITSKKELIAAIALLEWQGIGFQILTDRDAVLKYSNGTGRLVLTDKNTPVACGLFEIARWIDNSGLRRI